MYKPVVSSITPAYSFMKLERKQTTEQIDFAVIGVPFDMAATNRTGQRYGPQHIRNFSGLLRPYNLDQRIKIFDYCTGVDYGDIEVIPGNIHKTYENIEKELNRILENRIIPVMMGGDHSITLGHLRAVAKHYGPVALVHFDSHSDTWDELFGEKYSHATPFRRAVEEGLVDVEHSIQIGMRGPLFDPEDIDGAVELGFKILTMREVRNLGFENVIRQIHERAGNKPVFVSYDIDFLDPSYAPGTGTPEVGGPTSFEGLEFIRRLDGLNIIGFDLVEVLPAYDSGDITAAAAANIIYEMITLIALKKKAEKKD